jgi:methylated-DNA-[protein]-cysteine S-methyltransferase
VNIVNIGLYEKDDLLYEIGSYEGKLCLLDIVKNIPSKSKNRIKRYLDCTFIQKDNELIESVRKDLDSYFDGKLKTFNTPLMFFGTDFQKVVWNALLKIPYGETISYKEEAKMIGSEKSVRAVANANGANNIAIIVPCHRVIGSNGDLRGYASGVDIKKRLLDIEKKFV